MPDVRADGPGAVEAKDNGEDSVRSHAFSGSALIGITRDTVVGMADVSIRDLRNHGGDVVDRVARGERVTITRAGRAVAELRPLARRLWPPPRCSNAGADCPPSTRSR